MPKLTLVTVVGARPQFVKAATVSRAIAEYNRGRDDAHSVREILVHTGQHYDHNMSQVFFEELGIAEPAINLKIGSGRHGEQTGRMLEAIEEVLISHQHTALLVYGDTNSTLAGALAAAKLHTPVLHVEAGLRSHNKRMPEEVNRILTDQVSSLLFCPTLAAVDNLRRESITEGVFCVGDVMCDSLRYYLAQQESPEDTPVRFGLEKGTYLLATLHRAENTDDPAKLGEILRAFGEMASKNPVCFVIHPRTKNKIQEFGLTLDPKIVVLEPLPYLEMVQMQSNARAVITDSGGMQKEACILGRPCLTLREETEWEETVEVGINRLVGSDRDAILSWHQELRAGGLGESEAHELYGDGNAAGRILDTIIAKFD